MKQDPFKMYIKQTEPNKKYKGYAWSTAIGLQAVDGLKPSEKLIKTANIKRNLRKQNVNGKMKRWIYRF